MSSFRTFFAVVAGVFCVGLGRSALAATPACAAMVVEADDAVHTQFPELPEHVLGTFVTREGIDSCAKVALSLNPPVIVVEVTLADGRSASRSVAHREDVVPVLEALLVLPQDDAPVSRCRTARYSQSAAESQSSRATAAAPVATRRARRITR